MVKVGLIGLGFMGQTHFRCYEKLGTDAVKVVAIADVDERRARGDLGGAWGNIEGAATNHISMDGITGTTDYRALLALPEVDVVDICVPTPLHAEIYAAAIDSGRHVISEKPLALTVADGMEMARVAARAKGMTMPAMCIRFWPAYSWAKAAVADQRYGNVLGATFRRVVSVPPGWYRDGTRSGGAILDLHVHDTDFVCHLFGMPQAVFSRGYTHTSGKTDHLVTHYVYKEIPLVVAEGGWAMAEGFGFNMSFTINFDHATLDFDFSRPTERQLLLSSGGKAEPVQIPSTDGWFEEIRYFIECVTAGRTPTIVTIDDAVRSLRVVDAETESISTGTLVQLK